MVTLTPKLKKASRKNLIGTVLCSSSLGITPAAVISLVIPICFLLLELSCVAVCGGIVVGTFVILTSGSLFLYAYSKVLELS